jgi:hypothetical protein
VWTYAIVVLPSKNCLIKHDCDGTKDHGLIKTQNLIFASPAEQGLQKLNFGFY